MTLTPGTRLGPYEIVAPLGAGGMGEVYRARDARLGRDVAIKALPAAFARDTERLARFQREAQALAALNHPNVASIYGLEDATGAPYLVLELVEGESLAARLGRGALPLREALALGVQVAAAIEAAHERGIVHRDLKPGNVMVSESGVAKVLDFGLAKSEAATPVGTDSADDATRTLAAVAAATEAGVILGTAAYMSPEQARGRAVDRRSDVWSFGCVLFECLSGRAPFGGETVTDLLARILEREPDWTALPAGTPARVREILRRCLRKDADERPRDIRDVRLELAEAAAGGAKGAEPEGKSIAVLPFENLSGADDEYFADGVTDEILNALAQVKGLRVAARTSCFAFKGRREDLRAVGEKLDVTTVLEGSVRRAGQRLRITVQLVNAADGYQLWSERYDREMTDVFEVQEEIAGAIATRLRVSLRGDAERAPGRAGTRNLEAYELLLRGRALHAKRGRFLRLAVECIEKAVALDPRYAEALALLADSYRLMATFGVAPPAQASRKAKRLAEQAIAIDPEQAQPWATLACIEEQYEWNFALAESHWQRTLSIDPRLATARAQRAVWACFRGALSAAEGLAETRRAVDDDPLNSWGVAMNSYMLGFSGRHEESLLEAERAVSLDADSFFPQWNRLRAHAWLGRLEQAIALAPVVLAESGRHQWVLGLLAWVYGRSGRLEEARAVRDEMDGRSRHEWVSPFWLATAASAAGLPDEALRQAECAVREHDPLILWSRVTPFWVSLREHPGFDGVIRPVWS
jgi:eukaryotic-like serine/threonine-protein kinase